MRKLPSREVRAARWIEFAEFMESLKEEKFNHSKWCQPDHTCKTNACVAGWGAILYTEQAKNWLDLVFERQKLDISYQNDLILYQDYNSKRFDLDSSIRKVNPDNSSYYEDNNKSWVQLGKDALYLSHNTSEVLFYPVHSFWYGVGKATSKDIALIFRYMATFHGRLGRRFDRKRMQKIVDQYKAA